MVIEIPKQYMCGFEGCGHKFYNSADAEKCEARGVEGPVIESGLVVRLDESDLFVFRGTFPRPRNHQRVYPGFMILTPDIDPGIVSDIVFYSALKNNRTRYTQLPEDEFSLFLEQFKKETESWGTVRNTLSRKKITHLYREHEIFEPQD